MLSKDDEAKALRERFASLKGMTKAKFAEKHGIPGGASMLSQHLSGNRPISLESAIAYARGFNVLLDEISPRCAAEVRAAAPLLDASQPPPAPVLSPESQRALMLGELFEWIPQLPKDDLRQIYMSVRNAAESAVPPTAEPPAESSLPLAADRAHQP